MYEPFLVCAAFIYDDIDIKNREETGKLVKFISFHYKLYYSLPRDVKKTSMCVLFLLYSSFNTTITLQTSHTGIKYVALLRTTGTLRHSSKDILSMIPHQIVCLKCEHFLMQQRLRMCSPTFNFASFQLGNFWVVSFGQWTGAPFPKCQWQLGCECTSVSLVSVYLE